MTDKEITFRPVPGPAFLDRCTVSTWLHAGALAVPVAYVLIGHAPPQGPDETAESVEAGLLGMADAMGMRPAAEQVPHIGNRLIMRGPFVTLDYGHPQSYMQIPAPGDGWRRHVAAGGQACLTLGLDPIPPGAGPDAVEAYLARVLATGRACMGATTVRNP
jgi:hypothetical protein